MDGARTIEQRGAMPVRIIDAFNRLLDAVDGVFCELESNIGILARGEIVESIECLVYGRAQPPASL
jgi:hypothetical protein